MAWALDSAATPLQTVGGTTVTVSHTLGSGSNRIVIAVGMCNVQNITGITYNGVAMTAATNAATGTGESRVFYMLEAELPAAGTYDAVLSANSGNLVLHVLSYTGIAQTTPESTAGESYGNVSSIADAVTPTTDAALIISGLMVGDPRTITPDSGQGTAVSSIDPASGTRRNRVYDFLGPTPAALVDSNFTLSSASASNAQHLVAFGIATASVPKFLPEALALNPLVGVR